MAVKTNPVNFSVIPKFLDRPVRIAFFGDSTSNIGNLPNSGYKDICDIENAVGAFTAAPYKMQYRPDNSPLLGRIIGFPVANGGISGNTTSQMLLRDSAVYSTGRRSIDDVINKKPDLVVLHGASINDCIALSPGFSQGEIDAIASRHVDIVNAFTSCGIPVLDIGAFGYSGGDYLPATAISIKKALLDLNVAIGAIYDSAKNPLWKFKNPKRVLHADDGTYFEGYSTDGVHLNANGASVLREVEYSLVGQIVRGKFIQNGAYNARADFANASSGTPENHTITLTNISISSYDVNSSVARYHVNASSVSNIFMMQTPLHSSVLNGMVSGDKIIANICIKVTDLNGNPVKHTPCRVVGFKSLTSGSNYIEYKTESFHTYGEDSYYLQFVMPCNASDLSTSGTNRFALYTRDIPIGNHIIEIRPIAVMKY